MGNRWGNSATMTDFILGGSKITADGDCSQEIKRRLVLGRKAMTKHRQHIKNQRHYFANTGPSSQCYGFPSSHVWSWTVKKAECWRIDAFELWCWRRPLRVPWSARRFNQSVNPKGNQCWIFIGRNDAEVEAQILWPLDVKNWLTGKDWCQERLKAGGEGDKRGWDG